jgi:hypothetical protein
MPKTPTEIALQQEAIRLVTEIVTRAFSANKTPREVLEADPFLLGQTTTLGNLLSNRDFPVNVDVPTTLIDLFV